MKAKKYLRIPAIPLWWPDLSSNWRAWLPSRGNVLFTLLVVAGLLWASSAGALPLRAPAAAGTSTGTIAYQGRLADSAGTPITDTVNMEFRLYDVAEGGTPLWEELWTGANAVRVSDGLFNVMLGSLEPIPQDMVAGHDQLYLGITVGTDDEMTPRVQLGSVPFAVQALTVPDGSITTEKIADEAVTSSQLNLNADVDLQGHWLRNAHGLQFTTSPHNSLVLDSNGDGDDIRLVSDKGITFFIDANHSSEDAPFRIERNSGHWGGAVSEVFKILESGYIDARGTLNMHGNPIVNQGAMVEAGLQTPEELAAESIDRFSEGDVLCWASKQLEKCDQANDRRVVAVADENGKPIIIGAELIKVRGPVKTGDLLVASEVPGYAVVNNQPAPGTVIAKALEEFAGKRGTIKAMIRTP